MTKALSGSPVPRDTVFILFDGAFVVRWDERRVQELLSGRYRKYSDQDFGQAISNYELNQLQMVGCVEHYNDQYVWLYDLPGYERASADGETMLRVRSYYLNTTLPKSHLEDVEAKLHALSLQDDFLVRIRGGLVAILSKNGAPFRQLKDAERAQRLLNNKAPEVFRQTAIAFIETNERSNNYKGQAERKDPTEPTNLIASQTDVSVSKGKHALVLIGSEEERQAIAKLLVEMKMSVMAANNAVEGLHLLEDYHPDLLVMGMQLPDMHGWELLAKIKEIGTFRSLPKIVIADHHAKSDDQAFALTVGKVDVYLVKPISMARLRQNVWLTLKNAQEQAE